MRRTHRRKHRLDLQLISRLPCWLDEGRRDVGRHAGHELTLARHSKRTERVGQRHDQAAMHRLAIFSVSAVEGGFGSARC